MDSTLFQFLGGGRRSEGRSFGSMSALESGNLSFWKKGSRAKDLSVNHSTNSPVTSLMRLLTVAALGTQRAAARFAIWLPLASG